MTNTNDKRIKSYTKTSVYADLKDFCTFSINKQGHFIEVTEWYNGEGFDLTISTIGNDHTIQMSYGQFDGLVTLVKQLEKVKQAEFDRTHKLADLAIPVKPKAYANNLGLQHYPSTHDSYNSRTITSFPKKEDDDGCWQR